MISKQYPREREKELGMTKGWGGTGWIGGQPVLCEMVIFFPTFPPSELWWSFTKLCGDITPIRSGKRLACTVDESLKKRRKKQGNFNLPMGVGCYTMEHRVSRCDDTSHLLSNS